MADRKSVAEGANSRTARTQSLMPPPRPPPNRPSARASIEGSSEHPRPSRTPSHSQSAERQSSVSSQRPLIATRLTTAFSCSQCLIPFTERADAVAHFNENGCRGVPASISYFCPNCPEVFEFATTASKHITDCLASPPILHAETSTPQHQGSFASGPSPSPSPTQMTGVEAPVLDLTSSSDDDVPIVSSAQRHKHRSPSKPNGAAWCFFFCAHDFEFLAKFGVG